MKFKLLGAVITAPTIVFGSVAMAKHLDVERDVDNLISFNPTICSISGGSGGDTWAAEGTDGRVFIKFDAKPRINTVTARCTMTGLSGVLPDEYSKEGFHCDVHMEKSGVDHLEHIVPTGPSDPDSSTTLRVRDGKASLSCSGPYTGDPIPWKPF